MWPKMLIKLHLLCSVCERVESSECLNLRERVEAVETDKKKVPFLPPVILWIASYLEKNLDGKNVHINLHFDAIESVF